MHKKYHNLLMLDKNQFNMFTWSKEGILINFGQNKGLNLSNNYIGNEDNVLEYLNNLLDEDISYRQKVIISEVMQDLKRITYNEIQ